MSLPARFDTPLLRRLQGAGVPLDLRQAHSSLVFATFPVTSLGTGGDLPGICDGLLDHFIELSQGYRFRSRLKQLTFSPKLNAFAPNLHPEIKLSHRPAGGHVLATVTLDIRAWQRASPRNRRRVVIDALIASIDRILPNWLDPEDRCNLLSIFLAARV